MRCGDEKSQVREEEEEGGARAVIAKGDERERGRETGGRMLRGVMRLVFQDDVPADFLLADCAVLCLRGAERWWLNGGRTTYKAWTIPGM